MKFLKNLRKKPGVASCAASLSSHCDCPCSSVKLPMWVSRMRRLASSSSEPSGSFITESSTAA